MSIESPFNLTKAASGLPVPIPYRAYHRRHQHTTGAYRHHRRLSAPPAPIGTTGAYRHTTGAIGIPLPQRSERSSTTGRAAGWTFVF